MLVKAPKFELKDFPPKGFRKEHTIANKKENWWTLAKDYGYGKDAWALIVYNFNTRNPKEVNWYLREKVGCTRSEDGKNYSFSPGEKIYIPPVGWKPDYDELLRRTIIGVLTSHHLRRMNVRVGRHTVNWHDYILIGNLLIDRAIRVRYDPKLTSQNKAVYDPVKNVLRFGFYSAPTVPSRAHIIHEVTHAILDKKKANNLYGRDSEAAAYIAQCTFAWLSWGETDRLAGKNDDDPLDKIFDHATDVSIAILDHREPAKGDLDAMFLAIKNHPWYKSSYGKKRKYHGIP